MTSVVWLVDGDGDGHSEVFFEVGSSPFTLGEYVMLQPSGWGLTDSTVCSGLVSFRTLFLSAPMDVMGSM